MDHEKKPTENENSVGTSENKNNQESTLAQVDNNQLMQEKDERIATLEQELQIAKKNESEAMIRARAEIDNVRKRVEQDIEKAHKFALEKFSSELLPVIDNLERAISSADKNNSEHKAMLEGLELTLKSFLDTVKKFGIEAISTDDNQLNPDVHQAISMVESTEHESGKIINTIQKGYTLNGRLIRPAMVIVAK